MLIFFLLALASLCGYEEIPNEAHLPLLAPDWSARQEAKIRLENGLEAYLVSDPNTEESGAALTVKVGSWDEPETSPGLAHFLEHMLFLGTQKYPVESQFDTYLSSFRGQSNAFTYNDITSYMFAVQNSGFEEALDRFASFFKEPLFNPSGVNREVKAIDQEWHVHAQDNDFLQQFILKTLTVPGHPFSRFNAGNEESLKNASQTELKRWYGASYGANRMRLWVISPLPLTALKELVEKDFGGIARQENPLPTFEGPLFDPKILGQFVAMEPIQEETKLSLIWELPSSFAAWLDERPWSLLCWILGDEGENSVLATLKKEHLARALSCGDLWLAANKLLFVIEVDLTEQGLKEKDLVIKQIFQGLKRVQEKGISPQLFSEIQALQKLKYQWRPRKNVFSLASEHAFKQAYEPLNSYPEKGEVVTTYDPDKIGKLLEELVPEKAIYFLMAPQKKAGLSYPLKEKWTETPYLIQPYRYPELTKLEPDPRIDLPKTNRFIPEHLQLTASHTKEPWLRLPTPARLVDGDKGRLYFWQDTSYGVPQIYWSFELKTPAVNPSSVQSVVLAEIYRSALEDALSQVRYDAQVAGLHLNLTAKEEGFLFILSGYNEKAGDLLARLLQELMLPNLTEERFETIVAELKKEYKNFYLDAPLMQASELLKETIYHPFVTYHQKANSMRHITFEKFQTFTKRLFTKNYLEALVIGNLVESEAKALWQTWQAALPKNGYPIKQQKPQRVAVWPNQGPYSLNRKTKAPGTGLIVALQDPEFSFEKRGAQQILQETLQKAFFQELRTRQQTGYIVSMSSEEHRRALFESFFIQSASYTAEELLWRIETFIEMFAQELPTHIPQDRFDLIKTALLAQLQERPKSLLELGQLLQKLAAEYEGDFDWLEKRIEALQMLTYPQFLTLSEQFLSRHNRRQTICTVQGPLKTPFRLTPVKTPKLLKKGAQQL